MKTLPPAVEKRLTRFLEAVDRLPLDRLPAYAARPLDRAAHDAASERVRETAATSGRREAIAALERETTQHLLQRYVHDQFRPRAVTIDYAHSTGAVRDRLDVARSLAEAIAAIALSDLLDEADADELVGSWAEVAG